MESLTYFCQQCEDHFATAGTTGFNRTPFAALFLRDRISFRWHQHKLRSQAVAPLPWVEFKAFLRKSFGDSRSFVDTIWSRIKRDFQYQQEEVQDRASHLKHLQSILLEFDADGAPEGSTLIRLFREGYKPSIKAQMEQRGREKDSWEELVEKTIDAEAKAGLQPSSFVRDMDRLCPQGNRPPHTVAKSQASSTWDPRNDPSEKIGPQASSTWDPRDEPSEKAPAQYKPPHSLQSRSLRSKKADTSDKRSRREKKEQYRQDQERHRNSGTRTTGVIAPNAVRPSSGVCKDLSHITCFNCDQRGHYATNCSEPQKDASED